MEREEQLKILYPAIGAALVVILVGLLISLSDWSEKDAKGKASDKSGAKATVTGDDSGMTFDLPDPNSPEWKEGPLGIKIWDVKEGEGDACKHGANVLIHYTGWTLQGKIFDSSRKKGRPADFPLTSLIQGWQEGIPGMKPGGIRRLMIPPQYAYGERGSPPDIPPGATLIFEVKYLGSS